MQAALAERRYRCARGATPRFALERGTSLPNAHCDSLLGFRPYGKALAALIPGAKTVVLPGAGHMLLAEKPDDVLKAIAA